MIEYLKERVKLVEEEGVLDLIWINNDGSYMHNVFYDLEEITEYLEELRELAEENLEILKRPIPGPIQENYQDYYEMCIATEWLVEICKMLINYVKEHRPELKWNRALISDIAQVLDKDQQI